MLLETGRLHYRGPDGNGPAEVWDCTDTPGTYSLLPLSPDEKVAADAVMGAEGLPRPDLVVAVLDCDEHRPLPVLSGHGGRAGGAHRRRADDE